MKILFDQKRNCWKVDLGDGTHRLGSNDFMVLTGLRDNADRKFHRSSEIMEISKLEDKFLRIGLERLRKTPLVHSKGSSYKISTLGERAVDMIRRDEVEITNSEGLVTIMRKFLGFEAR
jgi:hypothetical protein